MRLHTRAKRPWIVVRIVGFGVRTFDGILTSTRMLSPTEFFPKRLTLGLGIESIVFRCLIELQSKNRNTFDNLDYLSTRNAVYRKSNTDAQLEHEGARRIVA
jgi:hypothetical protein